MLLKDVDDVEAPKKTTMKTGNTIQFPPKNLKIYFEIISSHVIAEGCTLQMLINWWNSYVESHPKFSSAGCYN